MVDWPCVDNSTVIARDANYGGGFKNVAYFSDWTVDRFKPREMPADRLTHVLHCFAVPGSDGTLRLENDWANFDMPLGEGQMWSPRDPQDVRGAIEQLFLLKKENRNLKVLLSVGGYRHSPMFKEFAHDPAWRRRFVESAIQMMKDFGMDGIDVDWEYPANDAEKYAHSALLTELRAGLNQYSARAAHGYRFEITGAFGVGWTGYSFLDFAGLDSVIDAWHLMTYDFKGFWSPTSGHHANLYKSSNPAITDLSIEGAVDIYQSHGIPSHKLVVGIPSYGHAFSGTDGLGSPFVTAAAEGVEYKTLPRPGATVYYDAEAVAAYSYDAARREMVSFDTPQTARAKAEFVKNQNLGGTMWWTIGNDKVGGESLVTAAADSMGWNFERKDNLLCYPESRFRNIRGYC